MKENENYNLNKSYKEIQEIIFNVLLYNINNIINYFNANIGEYCLDVFANVITLLACLWVEDKEHKSIFSLGKSKQKNAVKRTLNYYSTKNKNLFDSPILEKFATQNVTKNREALISEKNNIYDSIIKSNIEDKPENIPTSDIFDIKNYQQIYTSRQYDLNKKIKLLINEGFDSKSDYSIEIEEERGLYENILYKVDKLKVCYDDNEVYKYCSDMIKRKNYKKIKKTLYSWNNPYSDLDIFYKNKNIEEEREIVDEKYLKFKISNYLSNDMTRKFIVPILDIDYYMPHFQIFNYKEKLFNINEKTKINQYENIYKIDMKIFEEKNSLKSKAKSKFRVFNICYIKSTHHIRGKLFYEKKIIKK
jgi:hypothetical protein